MWIDVTGYDLIPIKLVVPQRFYNLLFTVLDLLIRNTDTCSLAVINIFTSGFCGKTSFSEGT